VHQDHVAGFAGQFDDPQWYAVDDRPVRHVALDPVGGSVLLAAGAHGLPQPAYPRIAGQPFPYVLQPDRPAPAEVRRHQPVRAGQHKGAAAARAYLVDEGEELHRPPLSGQRQEVAVPSAYR
jgi:hypothetical protein